MINSIIQMTQKNPGMPWHFSGCLILTQLLTLILSANAFLGSDGLGGIISAAFVAVLGWAYEGYQKSSGSDRRQDILANIAGIFVGLLLILS